MNKKNLIIALGTLFFLLVACCCTGNTGSGVKEPEGPDFTEIAKNYDTYGFISDTDGNALEGIVVSDGYVTTSTNTKGIYYFNRDPKAYCVNYSIPAAYEVSLHDETGMPDFWKVLEDGDGRFDFVLTPLAGGPETKFNLIAIGDPQTKSASHVLRFKQETMVDMKAHVQTLPQPTYAITMGDVTFDVPSLFPTVKREMAASLSGTSVFQTIGNHDHLYTAAGDVASQCNFEVAFGPVNYSFDRGNVHIVSMDNVLHRTVTASDYSPGFREEQYKWLMEDLSYVPSDKMVILCVHIPFRTGSGWGGPGQNGKGYYAEVLNLLSKYKQAHILCGHTHTNYKYAHTVNGKTIMEHINGTACGAWWNSSVNGDGTPNGYAVYAVEGAAVVNWYYKPVRYDKDFQIRLHRANTSFTGGSATLDYKFTQSGDDQIVANIWNSDPEWTVTVYENGVRKGDMTRYSDYDVWSAAYHVGFQGKSDSYRKRTDHMYWYTLQTPSPAFVKVEATDRFGNVYTQDMFIGAGASDYPVYR